MCCLEADHPVRVEHYLTLVGRALGIEYEDQYKKHTLLGNTDAILLMSGAALAAPPFRSAGSVWSVNLQLIIVPHGDLHAGPGHIR